MAYFLAEKLCASGMTLIRVYGRNEEKAQSLAERYQAEWSTHMPGKDEEVDVVFLALRDDALLQATTQWRWKGPLIAYHAGSLDITDLAPLSDRLICIWPLMSVHKEQISERTDIPLVIQGSDPTSLNQARNIAARISTHIIPLGDKEKSQIHLAAVFANNFSNHILGISQALCREAGVSFEVLRPLIEDTISKIFQNQAADIQTGPAIRKDERILEKQRALLHENAAWRTIYEVLTASIQAAKKNRDNRFNGNRNPETA